MVILYSLMILYFDGYCPESMSKVQFGFEERSQIRRFVELVGTNPHCVVLLTIYLPEKDVFFPPPELSWRSIENKLIRNWNL